MLRTLLLLAATALLMLAACNGDDDDATPTATSTPTASPMATATPEPAVSDCEARGYGDVAVGDVVEAVFACIESPLPGATVIGPIEVRGWSAGAFESTLVVDLLDGDGSILSRTPVMVGQPDIGLFVGDYAASMPMEDAPRFERGNIHVWAESPRDGSIMFDTTIAVVFGP